MRGLLDWRGAASARVPGAEHTPPEPHPQTRAAGPACLSRAATRSYDPRSIRAPAGRGAIRTPYGETVAKRDRPSLLAHARELTEALRGVRFFEGTELGTRFDGLRAGALALLEGKVIPELVTDLELPLFVALVGGTNTGKSTAFNALVGMLLSETRVTAGATKQPLVYLHRRWERRLLAGEVFPGVRCVLLADPVELTVASEEPRLYVALHERKELESVALIDSPDLDSIEPRNRAAAERVLTLADVCLFVTTPQKYKDRVLVADLLAVAARRKRVVLLFNQVEDEIVYNTIVEDIRSRLDGVELGGFLPAVAERRPEVVLRPRIQELAAPWLDARRRRELKRRTLRHGLAALVQQVRELVEAYRAEAARKRALAEELARQRERIEREYRQGARLPFPESAAALRRELGALELHRVLPLQRRSAASLAAGEPPPARALELVRQALALAGGRLTRWFAESLDAERPPVDWEAFREQRDRQDLVRVQQLALLLRSRIDARLRAEASRSQLALALLHRFFGEDDLERFEGEVERTYRELAASGPDAGRALLGLAGQRPASAANGQAAPGHLQAPARGGGAGGRLRALLANALKATGGLGAALLTGGLGLWDVLFFPAGFLLVAYGIAAALHLRHRQWRERFERERLERFRAVLERVFAGPFLAAVEQVASEEDMDRLERLCRGIEQADV
ncbi:MAG: hypothetical protein KatS3mg102_2516 [Planctomycetota bacterium]|nr:MAG: hypothetical protein KatS3mg102_2516 [Planctomycetota bacterium]